MATGHYARGSSATGRPPAPDRARDRLKDQSYFLWPLTQAQLARAHFPLGDLTKSEVARAPGRSGSRPPATRRARSSAS